MRPAPPPLQGSLDEIRIRRKQLVRTVRTCTAPNCPGRLALAFENRARDQRWVRQKRFSHQLALHQIQFATEIYVTPQNPTLPQQISWKFRPTIKNVDLSSIPHRWRSRVVPPPSRGSPLQIFQAFSVSPDGPRGSFFLARAFAQ